MEGGAVVHNFEREPPRDNPCQVWFNLVQQFQRRRFKCESLRRTTDGHQVMAKAHMAFTRWAKKYIRAWSLPGDLKSTQEQFHSYEFGQPDLTTPFTSMCISKIKNIIWSLSSFSPLLVLDYKLLPPPYTMYLVHQLSWYY